MAFVIRNVPAVFQRLINMVLAGVSNCEAYLDDVVVLSATLREHMKIFSAMFQWLAQANFVLNLPKWSGCGRISW